MHTSENWNVDDYELDKQMYDERIRNMSEDWGAVPTINRESLDSMKDGCFVRYVGMIQDVLNPEYYFASYTVKENDTNVVSTRCGQFRDILPCQETESLIGGNDATAGNQDIRHPLFCIPIPGVNLWALQPPVSCHRPRAQNSSVKRPFESDALEVTEEKHLRKDFETRDGNKCSTTSSYSCEKYFPLRETGGLACIVKHYGEHDEWLVNTRIEAIGFLSVSPLLEATWNDCDEEDRAMHPPPSLVPRLHALRIRKLLHCNPLLPYNPCSPQGLDLLLIRQDLTTTLAQLLFGDMLAAEYLLCNLLSSVYARNEGIAIGSLSVNFYNLNKLYVQLLNEFLKKLVPTSVLIPLSIDFLNNADFVPRKDYESNKLWSGVLQLADDTQLIVDETVMTPGQLQAMGIRNICALHSVSLRQSLRYDFTYFNLDFNTNIPVIVLSEGKSMIPTNVVLKLNSESDMISSCSEMFEAANFFISGERLEAVRKYLSLLRLSKFEMSEMDFVCPAWAELRQKEKQLNEDDLHRLLVISRLLAISEGRQTLERKDWEKSVNMEAERRSRII